MARSVEQIEHDIEGLSRADKERVFKHLLADFDRGDESSATAAEIEAEWVAVAERRLAELEKGTVEAVPLEDVMQRLRQRLDRER
ncbi:addiction module protein [Salinisphaera sp. T5B8]|uniref:addiction module protein n=1 Tax=Salinisphaera sp. T5B8 TaxID=1304154 RepID=UPI0033415CFF